MQFASIGGHVIINFVGFFQRFTQNEVHNGFFRTENVIVFHFVHIHINDCLVFRELRRNTIHNSVNTITIQFVNVVRMGKLNLLLQDFRREWCHMNGIDAMPDVMVIAEQFQLLGIGEGAIVGRVGCVAHYQSHQTFSIFLAFFSHLSVRWKPWPGKQEQINCNGWND